MFFNKTGRSSESRGFDNESVSLSFRDCGSSKCENLQDKLNALYTQFFEVLQAHPNELEVFETIQDIIHVLESTSSDSRNVENVLGISNEFNFLKSERSTWKLLHALYNDRILVQKADIDEDFVPLSNSEKAIVSQLYVSNANLREYQLVVDWLEACASEKEIIEIGCFTDRKVGWENTLYQLKNPKSVAFTSKTEIVKRMDPDAPLRENKPLHPLDIEDDLRLVKAIFSKIRQGRIEDAKSLCVYCGQPWRAATLEGWRLYEDPNYERNGATELLPIEGNPRRDLWKSIAYKMADCSKYDPYNRAIYGVLCGHLESCLEVLNDSWEDLLWAYMKVQIDIRVESEIRSCCSKNYVEMPEKYWNSKMTLEQIFEEISVHKNPFVRNQCKNKMKIIQKHIILDTIPELVEIMHSWVDEETLPPQSLRFFAHMILFFKQMNCIAQDSEGDAILKEYVECLIAMGNAQLVAFYTATLPANLQISLYSKFLEGINETQQRFEALEEASASGLDLDSITAYTVRNIRNIEEPFSDLLKTDISELDLRKISALEWLTFYQQHRSELLYQANAIIRMFLAEEKIECVRKVIDMVPANAIEQIVSLYGNNDDIPPREQCSIKEFLCHKTYLAAIDGFNDWTRLYHNRPKEPQALKMNAKFTEKMAVEHKEQAYRQELARWSNNLDEQTKISKDLLFNVLVFPDKGWLVDPDTKEINMTGELELRKVQLENIRKLCIPEVMLLLVKVLHTTGQYADCVKLAEEVASEDRQLYKVFPRNKLKELLFKISESSLALMNQKLDPWGYTITA